MSWLNADPQPQHAEAKVVVTKYGERCGACGGTLQHRDQIRCPYAECRRWFRGCDDPSPKRKRRRQP